MCKCTPTNRTPFCGKGLCQWPAQVVIESTGAFARGELPIPLPDLHLTLKRKWFDQMVAGKKDEEYREIKEYWTRRLMTEDETAPFRAFGWVYFKNGYQKNAPTMRRRWLGAEIRSVGILAQFAQKGLGVPSNGTIETTVFVIKLGPVENLKNYRGAKRYGRPPTIRKSRNVQKPAPAAKPEKRG